MDPRLLVAARSGDVDLLGTIAEQDADLLVRKTPFGNTALHIAVTFRKQEFVEGIYVGKPELLGERNMNDETPLHTAAILGNEKAIGFFLRRPAAPDVERGGMEALLRAVDRDGNNALHAALLNRHAEVAQELVSADRGLAVSINKQKESPLYLAIMRGFPQIAKQLLECDQCDHSGPRGQTALHAAVIGGHRETARELLKRKTELSKEKDDEEKTPLHYAVTLGDLEMVRLLLEHDSSAAYVADGRERLPVHLCASRGHVAVFFELFGRCPDAVYAADGKGRNALHIAIERQNKLVRRLLMTPGLERLLNQRDNEGKTPLHIALEEHNPRILQRLLRSKKVDMSVTDQRGLTAAESFYTDKEPHLCPAWYASHWILSSAWAKDDASKLNFVKISFRRIENKLLEKMLDTYPHNLSLVAVLIATVTFAAAFMIPGGYVNEHGQEQGLAVLSKKAAIKVFLIFDTISMCCSFLAAYFYSTTAVKQEAHQWLYAKLGRVLVSLAFLGMIIAFATGVYAIVAPDCLWLGILICFLCCCSLPFLTVDMDRLSFYIAKIGINIDRVVDRLCGNKCSAGGK